MDKSQSMIEYKLDLLLKDRQIMGDDGCIHNWVSMEMTDEEREFFIRCPERYKMKFECAKCGTIKGEGVLMSGI